METADVVVIGAGANGTSTAFHLAKAGGCCHRTWWINRSLSAKTLRAGFSL
jgi:glycine/D-amino acid oxidase-like deaminating enzyme